jgi:heterodisulfide reductase subunit C
MTKTARKKTKAQARTKPSTASKKAATGSPPTLSPPPSASPPVPAKAQEPKRGETGAIHPEEFDPHFKHEISKMPGGEKLKQCFQCGTCTSDCPIARFSDSYRPRQIIRMAQLGLKNRVLSSDTLWLCAACYTCTDRCPQDVEVASVIRILKNVAVQRGFIPPIFKELGSSILETGIAYRIPELRLKKRGQAGLPPLPKGNAVAIVKLADATGFSKTLKEGEPK